MRKNPVLKCPLGALNDPEGDRIPRGFSRVIDAHVHLFPDPIFNAVWQWFDGYGWPVRYRMQVEELPGFLFHRGVDHAVGLIYAHKPGIARELNRFMAGACRKSAGRLTGLGTVFPGEPDAAEIIAEAFDLGLAGIKLHAHVQCFEINSPEMAIVYESCEKAEKPLVMHAGREPKSPAYPCDPYILCRADKIERVLAEHPALRICIPHLGGDEFAEYGRMIREHDNLWLDTAMVITDYLPMKNRLPLGEMRIDRILYGSDFPNIPYAWDRELKALEKEGLSAEAMDMILAGNAVALFGIEMETGRKK